MALNASNSQAYDYQGNFYAFRLLETVKIQKQNASQLIKGKAGEWLVMDPLGSMFCFAAPLFSTTFIPIPGKQCEFRCSKKVLATKVVTGGIPRYLVQDDEQRQVLWEEEDFNKLFILAAASQKPAEMFELTNDNSYKVQRKTIFYCFQVKRQFDAAMGIKREDGGRFEAHVDDWLVCSANGQMYTVTADSFANLFNPIPTTRNMYRDKQVYMAKNMACSFMVKSFGVDFFGQPGDWLVQGDVGQQQIFSACEFADQYEQVGGTPVGFREDSVDDDELPATANRRSVRFLSRSSSMDRGSISMDRGSMSMDVMGGMARGDDVKTDDKRKSYSSSADDEDIRFEGFLMKKVPAGLSSKWKKYWFTLAQGTMFYYDKQDSTETVGEIPLVGADMFNTTINREDILVIESADGKTHNLQSESITEQVSLLDTLRRASVLANISGFYTNLLEGKAGIAERAFRKLAIAQQRQLLADVSPLGQHPIHLAAQSGNLDSVRLIVDREVSVNWKNDRGETPLHIILRKGPPARDVVPYLLRQGADVGLANDEGTTCLHLSALSTGDIVKAIMDKYKGPSMDIEDSNANTPLVEMCRADNVDGLRHLVTARANTSHNSWRDGSTPLSVAAAEGSARCAAELCRLNLDVSSMDFAMCTPLLNAAIGYAASSRNGKLSRDRHQGYVDTICALLRARSDPNSLDGNGMSPLLMVCTVRPDADTAPIVACVTSLLDAGADINFRASGGFQAIHFAALSGLSALVECLILKGSGVNAKTSDGFTPLDHVHRVLSGKGTGSESVSNIELQKLLEQIAYSLEGQEAIARLQRTSEVLIAKGGLKRSHAEVPVETDTAEMMFMPGHGGTYKVKAGTLNAIIDRLTHHIVTEIDDHHAFVLHYDKFMTANELLQKLIERFRFATSMVTPETQTAVRANVVIILDIWLKNRSGDFGLGTEANPTSGAAMTETASAINPRNAADLNIFSDLAIMILESGVMASVRERVPAGVQTFKRAVKNCVPQSRWAGFRQIVERDSRPNMKSALIRAQVDSRRHEAYEELNRIVNSMVRGKAAGKASKILGGAQDQSATVSLSEFTPVQIAQQLALLTHALLCNIPLPELMGLKYRDEEKTPNFHCLKNSINRVSFNMVSEVLKSSEVNVRAASIEQLIRVAEICMSMKNFDSVVTIMNVLWSGPIHRLKLSWAKVEKSIPGRWSELESTCGPTCRNVDKVMLDATPPCVPCVGGILKHLILVNEEPGTITASEAANVGAHTESKGESKTESKEPTSPTGSGTPTTPPAATGVKLINFSKIRKTAHVVATVQKSQETPFLLDIDNRLLTMLVENPSISNEDSAWERSQALEAGAKK